MKAHFSNKRRIKRYYKRLPMDTGYDYSYLANSNLEIREYRTAGIFY